MFKNSVTMFTVATMFAIMSFSTAFAATDKEISRSVRKELFAAERDPLGHTRVSVFTRDGVVYLYGTVERFSQINQMGQMAAMADGVNQVVNQLKVHSSN